MKLTLNREFALRYGAVALLFLGMGGWFGFDGLVRYPRTDAAELYRSIEKAEPPEGVALEKFKRQKVESQLGLMVAALCASAAVAFVLLKAASFRFEFDDAGFVCRGVRHGYAEIGEIDFSRWAKKGIVLFGCGRERIVLDAWHHAGVGEFVAHLPEPAAKTKG